MSGRKIFFGVALILLGLLLLGRSSRFVIFDFGDLISFLLPFAFIAAGTWFIIRRKRQEDRIRAQMYNSSSSQTSQGIHSESGSGQSDFASANDFARKQESEFKFSSDAGPQDTRAWQAPHEDEYGKLKYSKLLGDLFIDCKGLKLENVDVSGLIGDIEIKLHGGVLSSGLNRLVISQFIGDVRILIPGDIPHFAQCSNFIGDIELGARRTSGFSNNVETHTVDYETAPAKLYISANNFIGDIRLLIV